MPEISNMIRWNANFVRGLAQSVLERARVIRGSLAPTTATPKKTKRKSPRKARARKSDG
jgi:hypothetical protein